MEEYKQLKDSMNKGQDQHGDPQQPLVKSQQAAAQDSVPPHQEKNEETDSLVVLR